MNLKSIICPVSTDKLDKNVSRIGALLTSASLGLFIYSDNILILAIILSDYVIRVFFSNTQTPFGFIAKKISPILGIEKNITNKGPKIFAWRTGFIFALSSFVTYFFSPSTSIIVAEVLLIFNLLDGLANICFGCIVYTYIILPIMNPQTDIAK